MSKNLALWICKMKTGYDSENYFLENEGRFKMAFEMFKTIFLESVARTTEDKCNGCFGAANNDCMICPFNGR